MKKIIVLILIMIVIIASIVFFHNSTIAPDKKIDIVQNTTTNSLTNTIADEVAVPKYVDDNPISVGIYEKSGSKRVLVSDVTKPWTYHKDIIEYNAFFTQNKEIDGTRIPTCFDKYAALYEKDVSKYRVGYIVEFSTDTETINKTIIRPKDTEEFYDILEIYLYDGYHRAPGEWYSHTLESEFNDKTLLLGIKLTAGKQIEKIKSNITLTAFSYDSDDFDEDGNYRGISKYSITIHKK